MQYLHIIESLAGVNIPKEKRTKLDEHSWYGIFVGYEEKNRCRTYDHCIETVHMNENIKIDKKNSYDKFSVSQ